MFIKCKLRILTTGSIYSVSVCVCVCVCVCFPSYSLSWLSVFFLLLQSVVHVPPRKNSLSWSLNSFLNMVKLMFLLSMLRKFNRIETIHQKKTNKLLCFWNTKGQFKNSDSRIQHKITCWLINRTWQIALSLRSEPSEVAVWLAAVVSAADVSRTPLSMVQRPGCPLSLQPAASHFQPTGLSVIGTGPTGCSSAARHRRSFLLHFGCCLRRRRQRSRKSVCVLLNIFPAAAILPKLKSI